MSKEGKMKSSGTRCHRVRLIGTSWSTRHVVIGLCCSTMTWEVFYRSSLILGRPTDRLRQGTSICRRTWQICTERHHTPMDGPRPDVRLHTCCTGEWCPSSRLLFLVWVGSRWYLFQRVLGSSTSSSSYL